MSPSDTNRLTPETRLALLMHDHLTLSNGKMGLGMLRYSELPIVAVVDRLHAGGDVPTLTGIARQVPIVATSEEAAALGANALLLGVANTGGILPPDWWDTLKAALRSGMSLVNSLHAPLADHPDLAPLLHADRFIWDVRVEPPGLPNGMGRAKDVPAKRVLTVGTDMAIGKMTAAIELDRAARRRGFRSKFLATGQTGICIAGEGVALDAVRVDFATGAVESLVLKHGYDHDLLFVEGQGSLLNPASTAWLSLIRGSIPTHLILAHRAGQQAIRTADWVKIPPLLEVIALYEAVTAAGGAYPPARVVGITLNTAALDDRAAQEAIAATESETGLPVTDVVRYGAEPLLEAIVR